MVETIVVRVSGGVVVGLSGTVPGLRVVVVDEDDIEAGGEHPFGSEEECERALAAMHPLY